MGRHADTSAPRRAVPRVHPRVLAALAVVVAVAVGGAVWATSGSSSACESTRTVRVTVAPEAAGAVRQVLGHQLSAGNGRCVSAAVTAQQPLQTVGNLGALRASSLPQVWVPDSSLWAARAGQTPLTAAGSLASSPVVLATSRQAAAQLGWDRTPPSWGQALTVDRPIALPDLPSSAEGLAALSAVRTALGGNTTADDAIVAAVLAAARRPTSTTAGALEAGSSGASDAPLVPVTEQQVLQTNRGAGTSSLVAIYPKEGSPRLDYPILRVGHPTGADRAAVDTVVATLTSPAAREAARQAGFRDMAGDPPVGAGPATGVQQQAPAAMALDPVAVSGLLTRLASLTKPSRLLTVIDVSTSMNAPAGAGTRATLARDATKSALTLLPDSYAGGLWDFAYHLQGDQDWQELAPIRAFGADAGNGQTQRQLLNQQFDSIPSRLRPGGTGLYDTALAAVRAARAAYDPAAVNSVVLITDGKNEDDTGITLANLLITLHQEADPARPVKVVAIALGPDADLQALQQIADATGGAAYQALDPRDLQSVLFDAIRRRQ